jgi:hypothetical protein
MLHPPATFGYLARQMGLSPRTLNVLLASLGCHKFATRAARTCKLMPAEVAEIQALIGSYTHYLFAGTPHQRPIRFHQDFVYYFEVSYLTYTRWLRQSDLSHLLPKHLGRRILLPTEVELIHTRLTYFHNPKQS